MKRSKLKGGYSRLVILSILAVSLAVPTRAEEKYSIIATLQSPSPCERGRFGSDIAVNEDILVIGEILGLVDGETAGRGYVFNSDWTLISTLRSPTPHEGDQFGHSVDVLDDIVVVSSPHTKLEGSSNVGEAYVFTSDGSLQFTLQSSDPKASGYYGYKIVLGSDIIVVAELGGTIEPYFAGSVQIYNAEGVYLTTLVSPSMKTEAEFGRSMAASNEFIIVGEPGYFERPTERGSVHVFDYDWNQVATLNAPEQGERTLFGYRVATDGDIIVVGEPWATADGHEKAGRAHIFDTSWNYLAALQAPNPGDLNEFGIDVAVGGDIIVVGERKGDVSTMNEGKTYVFDLEGNLISTLTSPEPSVGTQFGWRVDTDEEIVVVAEVDATVDGESKAGKVHVFGPGPGAEPEAEPEPVSTQEEAKPEAEEKKPGFAIPGFPYESIIVGLMIGAFVLWLIQSRR